MSKNLILSPILGPQRFFCGFSFYQTLDIVASYHCMQFQVTITNQTSEKWQKTKFRTRFWLVWPKFEPQNFFCGFYLHQMSDIAASYHCMQFQRKLMIQNQENDEKLHFGPNLETLVPNSGQFFFFCFFLKIQFRQSLDIMVSKLIYNIRKN